MEMVAASKLTRFQKLRAHTTPYVEALEGVLNRLLAAQDSGRASPILRRGAEIPQHPLLETREEKETALLVITSDTGLCGSYNHSLVGEAKKFLQSKSRPPVLIGVGKNGVNALSRAGYTWFQDFADTKAVPFEFMITEISLLLEELFSERRVDAVYAVYTHFTSKSAYRVTTEKILPFALTPSPLPQGEGKGEGMSYIMEPSREGLFTRLIPLVFAAKMRMIFMESVISEHMARMNAMHQATENAKELIDTLVLLRNKIRQASITKELIEIVSGSKALKQ